MVVLAERTLKSASFKTKNNAQTLSKQLQNKLEKVEKTTFSTPKIAKNYPSNQSKEGNILTKNLKFRVHLWSFGAKKSP